MENRIKELRVKIDGLSQLANSVKSVETKIKNPDYQGWGAEQGDPFYIIKKEDSKEIQKATDSLYLSKAWLGKILGEIVSDTPYANDGKRKSVEDIESASDTAKSVIDTPEGKRWYNHSGLVLEDWFNQSKSHIEKVDWLRQEIKRIIDNTEDFSQDYPSIKLEQGFVYKYLSEARFWLGFELQRIRENEKL